MTTRHINAFHLRSAPILRAGSGKEQEAVFSHVDFERRAFFLRQLFQPDR